MKAWEGLCSFLEVIRNIIFFPSPASGSYSWSLVHCLLPSSSSWAKLAWAFIRSRHSDLVYSPLPFVRTWMMAWVPLVHVGNVGQSPVSTTASSNPQPCHFRSTLPCNTQLRFLGARMWAYLAKGELFFNTDKPGNRGFRIIQIISSRKMRVGSNLKRRSARGKDERKTELRGIFFLWRKQTFTINAVLVMIHWERKGMCICKCP